MGYKKRIVTYCLLCGKETNRTLLDVCGKPYPPDRQLCKACYDNPNNKIGEEFLNQAESYSEREQIKYLSPYCNNAGGDE